jgi:putative DNA primase/helicase
MEIPQQLKNFNFVLIDENGDGKKPKGLAWQKKIIRANDKILQDHLLCGYNYGVQMNESSVTINDKVYFLIVVDFDTKEFQDKVIGLLPETFATSSGSSKNCLHLWFASDNNVAFKIKDENKNTLADILGAGNQVIAVGSKHKSGSIYSVAKDLPIAFIPYAELEAILKPYDKSPKKTEKTKVQYVPKEANSDLSNKILNAISMNQALLELGVDTSKNPTGCPFHSSVGGKCFGFNNNTAHCFDCDGSWNAYSLIREGKKLTDKETFEWFAEKAGLLEELKKSRKEYKQKQSEKEVTGKIEDFEIFGKLGQAREFHKRNPFAYDRAGLFWIWNAEDKCYKQSDETDILNNIRKAINVDTIDGKERGEIMASLKQLGRDKLPKEVPSTWIQFKKKVIDIKTGIEINANPDYFFTSPIPWDIGESEDTPTIDKLFGDWVYKEHIQDIDYINTLQEVTAYALEDSAFMQTIIWLCGSGCNGKGCYMNFLMKLLGIQNVCSSELKTLVTRNFETSALYKRKAVIMGEVDTYDLTNTNLLKQLSGEDLIRYEFKGKTPFSQKSTTTCFIASNALPVTPDRSNGFYRRNLIIDFPNVFNVGKDVVGEIPDIEYMNFCKKSIRILKELHERGYFTNGGTIEDRKVRYEERSNPIVHFIETHCSESPMDYETFSVFLRRFQDYLKQNRLRPMSSIQTSRALKMEGYDVKSKHIVINRGQNDEEDTHITSIMGLKLLEGGRL